MPVTDSYDMQMPLYRRCTSFWS